MIPTERCNYLPWLSGKNSAATVPFSKPSGYRNFRVRFEAHIIRPIGTGKCIELNCVVQATGSVALASWPYRQSKVFYEDTRGYWYPVNFLFTGFPQDEMTVLVTIERRNDSTLYGTASQSGMVIRKTSGISEA